MVCAMTVSIRLPKQRFSVSFVSTIFLVAATVGLTKFAHAHPHNWIELNSRFVLNESAHLVQVSQKWEFDVFFSAMTLSDMLNEHGSEEKGLPETARQMVRNLAEYNYFSTLRLDGSIVDLDTPESYRLITKETDGHTVLELEMSFDIESGLAIENKTLEWQVFDPTYYIAMMHNDKNNIEIVSTGATECTRQLHLPDPSDDLLIYAQSLDRNEKSSDGLGVNFAEKTIVTCL